MTSSSALLTGGGRRQRFQVELRPGETTIVSWKKLVKDANKAVCINKSLSKPDVPVCSTVAIDQTLDSLNAPPLGESAENEANDAPHGSRFGAVIEKIERLYMGKNSSDEEDLNDVPDDDEYDTKDSFIDDAELDEYFQVDNSAIKHDGFFVNRGKLKRSTVSQNEPTTLPSQKPNKRRRKDSEKVNGGNGDGHINNIKVNNHASGKVVAPVEKNITISSHCKSLPTINVEDVKNVTCEHSEAKVNEVTPQTKKYPLTARKEGSYTKHKSTMLEKAIRDLEKIVVQSRRPPSMEVGDANSLSQAVKKRMPPEIRQKLAKVARLAHAIHGKISKELLNHLMNIVGHLIQLRSLRRNLRNMVNMGLSAKEEKDVRMQQLKKQIDDMVKIRAPMMKCKFQAMGQQVGASDGFQETGGKEKEILKRRITMDDTLEDKICDLYDLFVEGLDEDSGHQVRKLYAELAELWPKDFMDNHGIRRAICRAKDRRKALYRQKDQEKLKRKNIVVTKAKTVELEAGFSTAAMRSISNTLAAAPNKPNNESGVASSQMLVKKKKRKPETELCEAQIRLEKTSSAQAEERHK